MSEGAAGPIRVLHVITGLGRGGAERMLYTVCAESRRRADAEPRRGAPIAHHVASLLPGGRYRPLLEGVGIHVTTVDAGQVWRFPAAVLALARLIRRERPDVLQAWMYHANVAAALALMVIPKADRPRLIWGVRCSAMEVERYSWRLRVTLALHRLLRGLPDLTAVNSQAGRDDHLRLGLIVEPAPVIENGVDVESFAPADAERRAAARRALNAPDDAVVALTLARVDPMKDYPLLIETARRLPSVQFLAAGEGTERLEGPPNFRGLGARDDTATLLAAADLLISCSAYGEGMSNSIAEALAAGLPVAATDVGDAARLVGAAGRVVAPRDADALAEAVGALTADENARRALGATAARRMRQEFSISRAVDRFEALYRAGEG
ncbi:MAG: glycosyltransferase [Marivibrio sp.]|uniref:glycosyltransferase n=1 Tax=Marivibrio sp. TaxID=2039719 RepID=UPI0032ED57D8